MLPNRHWGYNPTSTPTDLTFGFFPHSSQLYPSRGQTITPLHHITARGNKGTRVEASHSNIGLPTPRSSLDPPRNLPSSDVHGLKAILSPHLAVNQMAFKNVNSFPTPQLSLDSSVNQLSLSFNSVLSRLKPLLDGTDQINRACKLTVVGISLDIVDKWWAKSEASDLPD
jgi:hypothetical protein